MEMQTISPELEKSTEKALTIVEVAISMEIVTLDDYKNAQSLMKMVKDRIKELNDTRMSQTRPIDEAKSKILAFFAIPLEKLEKAKAYLNKIMITFTEEQEARRREEERRLQEEARKRAEEETLRQAIEAEEAGESEEAAKIIEEPVYVPPIRVGSEIPKSKESYIRTTWSAEVVSLEELVHGIANGIAPLEAVKPNMPFLNSQATDYNITMKIPGVRAVSKKTQV